MSDFKAGVGIGRLWDAYEAGREVAKNTLENLGKEPHFFLLFPTIHFKKTGGFQRLLEGVWSVLPDATPLIGGTIPGWISKHGCFSRGVVAMAANYVNMDVAIGIGEHTKRQPQKAAYDCAMQLKRKLESSRYPNGLILDFPSGITTPKIPGFGKQRVIRNPLLARLMPLMSRISLVLLEKGPGREAEMLKELVRNFPQYNIIGGSSVDDSNGYENYQFFNRSVYTNALVALGLRSDLETNLETSYGLKGTGCSFNATKITGNNLMIEEIDGQPALEEMLKELKWPESYLDNRIHRKTFFTPIAYEKNGKVFTGVMVFFLGHGVMCTHEIRDSKVYVMSASGNSLIKSVEEILGKVNRPDKVFSFLIECNARIETWGANMYLVKDKLEEAFGDTPYLLLYTGGEDVYSPKLKDPMTIAESFNVAVLAKPPS